MNKNTLLLGTILFLFFGGSIVAAVGFFTSSDVFLWIGGASMFASAEIGSIVGAYYALKD